MPRMMTLRDKVEKLLQLRLPFAERQPWMLAIEVSQGGPLEPLLQPELIDRINGRFEWFFKPDGQPRRATA